MNKLPVCRLCKCEPQEVLLMGEKFFRCSGAVCELNVILLKETEWNKLMYIPERKSYKEGTCVMRDIVRVRGYNEALDDLERGGP